MAITRTFPNWSFGQKLTSDQANAIDINITNAVDKRSGQSDTVASNITVTGTMALNGINTVGGFTTFTAPIVTSNTIQTTGQVTFASGSSMAGVVSLVGQLQPANGAGIEMLSGSTLTADSGSTVNLNGTTSINAPTITNGSISGATITGGSVGAVSGIASLDENGQLTSAQRGGWLVASTYLVPNPGVGLDTTIAGVLQDVTGFASTLTCVSGDVLVIDLDLVYTNNGAGDTSTVTINVGGSDVASHDLSGTTGTYAHRHVGLRLSVGTGSIVVKVRAASTSILTLGSSPSAAPFHQTTLRVLQFRP